MKKNTPPPTPPTDASAAPKGKAKKPKGSAAPLWLAAPHDPFVRLCEDELGLLCVTEYRFHPTRRWRFDYALPSERIAIEQEGGIWTRGRHLTPKGFLRDMEKYNAATARGWRVLRFSPEQLCSPEALELLRCTLHGIPEEQTL